MQMKLICKCGRDVTEGTEIRENENSRRLGYTKTYVIRCDACNITVANDAKKTTQKFLKEILQCGFRIGFV